jgi:hypothetical protein
MADTDRDPDPDPGRHRAPGEVRDAITDLLYEYTYRIDAGDLDGVGDLFADATYRTVGSDVVLRGRDEVTAAQRFVMRLYDGSPRTHHNVGNVIVRVEPSGTAATSRSYFTVTFQPPGPGEGPRVILTGRYEDRFERVDGQWRFADRLIHMDQVGDLSEHLQLDRFTPPPPPNL